MGNFTELKKNTKGTKNVRKSRLEYVKNQINNNSKSLFHFELTCDLMPLRIKREWYTNHTIRIVIKSGMQQTCRLVKVAKIQKFQDGKFRVLTIENFQVSLNFNYNHRLWKDFSKNLIITVYAC